MDKLIAGIIVVVLVVGAILINAWMVMLLWGALVSNWLWPAAPAMGFGHAILVTIATNMVGTMLFKPVTFGGGD